LEGGVTEGVLVLWQHVTVAKKIGKGIPFFFGFVSHLLTKASLFCGKKNATIEC
jgi:hypothetical protein